MAILHQGVDAAIWPSTVQRLLGKKAGRLAVERARPLVRRRFTHLTLDGVAVRAALLDLVVQLWRCGQASRVLTLIRCSRAAPAGSGRRGPADRR
ncbi:hypothetical protein [Streptomyces sp. NPDC058294]|uniref:hypothetical protein n=1 Tax=Streptomyces sp. NPDC058294 TaxID=3346430 RepID=UPI0036ECEFA5